MSEIVVLTCASGKQCARIIPHLINNPKYSLRLVVNRQASLNKLKQQYPNAEVVQADLQHPDHVARIVKDASVILHIGPSFHAHETQIGYLMIDAATKESNLKHFIFSSVLNTQLRKLLNHDSKRYVEEYLMESELPWTILQPTTFLDSRFAALPELLKKQQNGEQLVMPAPYNPDTLMASVSFDDFADGFVKVLEERQKHFFAQYPLCSNTPVSLRDVVAELSRQLGVEVEIKSLSREEADNGMLTMLYGDPKNAPLESREQAQRMLIHYDDRGLKGNPNVMEWLLGRKPLQYPELISKLIKQAKDAQ